MHHLFERKLGLQNEDFKTSQNDGNQPSEDISQIGSKIRLVLTHNKTPVDLVLYHSPHDIIGCGFVVASLCVQLVPSLFFRSDRVKA